MVKIRMGTIKTGLLIALILSVSVSHAGFWQADNLVARSDSQEHEIQYFSSDEAALRRFLDQVPQQHSGQSLEIELPMPDGRLASYQISESSIMEPDLAARFPEIRSYEVRGIDYPGSFGRVDISHKGFRGMIDTPYGRIFIDPEQSRSGSYMSRSTKSHAKGSGFQCDLHELHDNQSPAINFSKRITTTRNRIPGSITAYRLAVSATLEYVNAVGGTLDDAMSEINTAINRVNQIYQRDLGIKLFLVADNDELIDVPPGTANFSSGDVFAMLAENQDWIDSQIGEDSYDVGHIFDAANTGGLARIDSVCSTAKAQGVTGIANPTNDVFYIDYVAHEIGHQFGGNHTFNGSTGSCGGGNRNGATAFEPGSGSTIMAYSGICGAENLQNISDATFHAGTIAEINAFVTDNNTGGSCATILPLEQNNADPTADAGSDRVIPMDTPFSLVGSASDADSDALSYQWDQMDAGVVATNSTTIGTDLGNNPLFRSFAPQPSGVRHLPLLENQLDNMNDIGEVLPVTARALNFRLTTRDCKSGQATDDVQITVDINSGPFVVNPLANTSFPGTSTQTVSWNVANTTNAPVSCANVDIDLLTFSADQSTYGVTSLAAGTPNDGTEDVTFGDKSNSRARIKVSCSDNIFYHISNTDLNITGATAFSTTGNTTALSTAASCGAIDIDGAPPGTTSSSSGSGGGGLQQPIWVFYLLVLLGLALSRSAIRRN